MIAEDGLILAPPSSSLLQARSCGRAAMQMGRQLGQAPGGQSDEQIGRFGSGAACQLGGGAPTLHWLWAEIGPRFAGESAEFCKTPPLWAAL